MIPVATGVVHLVTSRRRLSPDARTIREEIAALDTWLDEAIDAGVDLIQIRERDLDARPLRQLVASVVARTRTTRTRVLVNDRADVARVANADGVHLPAAGLPVSDVRYLEPRWTIGRSIHEADLSSIETAADYLMFGTVFPSASKPAGSPVAGLEGLSRAVRSAPGAVVAIGGITPERARACVEAGAAGVAAIGLFLPPGRAPEALGIGPAVTALRRSMHRDEAFRTPGHGNLLE